MHKAELKNKIIQPSNKFSPRKALGQNFLRDKKAVWQVIQAADLKPDDMILEIGPGKGALTLSLAKRVKKVVAIEKDKRMVQILHETLQRNKIDNVEIINEDILQYKPETRNPKPETNSKSKIPNSKQNYKLISNLPYNIATAVIMKFLEAKNPPQLMVVMVQKEVGQRICAAPPHMNKLAVFTQLYSQPKIIGYVSHRCFYPQPKVDSAILKIKPSKEQSSVDSNFSKIANVGFSQPRKQIINNLSRGLRLNRQTTTRWLQKNNIEPARRPQTLTIDEWLKLTATFPQAIM